MSLRAFGLIALLIKSSYTIDTSIVWRQDVELHFNHAYDIGTTRLMTYVPEKLQAAKYYKSVQRSHTDNDLMIHAVKVMDAMSLKNPPWFTYYALPLQERSDSVKIVDYELAVDNAKKDKLFERIFGGREVQMKWQDTDEGHALLITYFPRVRSKEYRIRMVCAKETFGIQKLAMKAREEIEEVTDIVIPSGRDLRIFIHFGVYLILGLMVWTLFFSLYQEEDHNVFGAILYKLKLGEIIPCTPTGFNVKTVDYKNNKFTMFVIGGQNKIRPLWSHYYKDTGHDK